MRCDLEYAVRRGIYNGKACAHMLIPQFLYDLCTAFSPVANDLSADPFLKFLDAGFRESLRKCGKRLVQNQPRNFPMPACGILALKPFCRLSITSLG